MQGLENFWFRKNLIGMVGIFIGALVSRMVTNYSSIRSTIITADTRLTLVKLRLRHLPALKGHHHRGPQ